jgi:hydrogenase nickel incorporation protein HypA/HybF
MRLVMHELAIAQSIVEMLDECAQTRQARRVKKVRLCIGEANGVVIDSLTFCFDMLTSLNPSLTGAQLVIDTRPHRAYCRSCHEEFPVLHFIAQCPLCERWSNDIVSGTEFQVVEMEIET